MVQVQSFYVAKEYLETAEVRIGECLNKNWGLDCEMVW
jgi:hypothetical protein